DGHGPGAGRSANFGQRAGIGNPAPRSPGRRVPAANEPPFGRKEVVIELAADTTDQAAQALAQRHQLTRVESFNFQLAGTKLYRWRINDGRSVPAVIRALAADRSVISVSANHIHKLDGDYTDGSTGGSALEQYALAKLQV